MSWIRKSTINLTICRLSETASGSRKNPVRKLAICASIIMKGYILIKNLLHCNLFHNMRYINMDLPCVMDLYSLIYFDVNVELSCVVDLSSLILMSM